MANGDLTEIYSRRFRRSDSNKAITSRNNAWSALYSRILKKYIQEWMTVIDLGSGPGYFANQVSAKRVIAVDLDLQNQNYLNKNVEFQCTSADDLKFAKDDCVDLVFTSNLFEHLGSREVLLQTLDEIRRVIAKNSESRLIILMPNVRYAKWDFFDFIDHNLPLNENSLREALELKGFKVIESHKKFFPYTAAKVKLSFPTLVIKIYLSLTPRLRPLAKQMFFVASPLDGK